MKYKESDDLNDLLSCAKTTPLTAEIYDTATSDIVATTDRTDAKKNNVKHIKQYY